MPTNLYGPGDNYDLDTSHVIAALIRKFHEAKVRRERTVTVWGSGTPRREFLHSDDMADGCIRLLELSDPELERRLPQGRPPLVNIGCGEDLTVAQLAERVRDAVGAADAKIVYDRSKPDGTPQKLRHLADALVRLGTENLLEAGLRSTYAGFLANAKGATSKPAASSAARSKRALTSMKQPLAASCSAICATPSERNRRCATAAISASARPKHPSGCQGPPAPPRRSLRDRAARS
jgi:hypothetical protein